MGWNGLGPGNESQDYFYGHVETLVTDDRRGREKEEKGEGLKTKGEKCVEINLVGGRLEILADK